MQEPAAVRSKILFLDWRDISPGSVRWLDPDGGGVPMSNPPEPQATLHASAPTVPYGIRLVAQKAKKSEPLEWHYRGPVHYIDGVYRSWHIEIDGCRDLGKGSPAHTDAPSRYEVVGDESDDATNWREFCRHPIDFYTHVGADGLDCFIDPHAPPEERYKLVYMCKTTEEYYGKLWQEYQTRHPRHRDWRIAEGKQLCLFAVTSSDGIRWQADRKPIMMHASDTDTSILWDEYMRKYVMYTRLIREGRRWIGRAETSDFYNWNSGIEPIIWPRLDESPDYDIYLNAHTRYPGLHEYRLMFPMVYHRTNEGSDVRLYSSVDGIAWSQVPPGPVLEVGDVGSWDSEFITGGKGLVPLPGDRIGIPYVGTIYPHKHPRWPSVFAAARTAWAYWPKDRLCAVQADRLGEFTTNPVIPGGRTLRLNFRTRAAGEIRVGILGNDGRSIDNCDPLYGDESARVVTWKGQSDLGVQESVKLQFRLRCAELFAVEFV